MKSRVLILILVLIFSFSLHPMFAQESAVYFPTGDWRTSSPEQQGMNSAMIADAVHFLAAQNNFKIHSLLVIRHGYIVADAYFYPFVPGEPHDLASVTKSVTATLAGIAIQQGFLQGVDQPVGDIITAPEDKAAITLENLLTMRSGIECFDTPPVNITSIQMAQTPDWSQFVLNLPMDAEPGTKWVYCGPAVHLLAALVQAAAGQNSFDFAMKKLFEPLGIRDVGWPRDPQGIVQAWGVRRSPPHAMAKIGYLYLNDGWWEGQQLLPENWVKDATRNIRAANEPGYGYLWWLSDAYYAAVGRGGQYILVVPDEELIVVTTGGGGDIRPDRLLDQFILSAVQSDTPLATNSAGEAALHTAIKTAAQAPEFKLRPVNPIPAPLREISGKTFQLEPNPFGLLTLSLTFHTDSEVRLHLTTTGLLAGDDDFSWVAGLDGVPRITPGRFDLPASATGQWVQNQANVLTMRVDEIGNNNIWSLRLNFDVGTVMMQMSGDAGAIAVTGKQK